MLSKWNELGDCEDEEAWEAVSSLETEVFTNPIRTMDDAMAKLQAVGLVFSDEPRADEADAEALRQTVDWIAANCAPTAIRLRA